jgi:preprotein translocase subunit SecG
MGGRQAVTLLTKVTWWCAGIFLLISLTLAIMSSHSGAPRSVLQGNIPAPTPVQSAPLPLQSAPSSGTPAPTTTPPPAPSPSTNP